MEIINLKLFIGATILFILQLFHKHAYPNPLSSLVAFVHVLKFRCSMILKYLAQLFWDQELNSEINNEHVKTSLLNITLLIRVIYLEVAHWKTETPLLIYMIFETALPTIIMQLNNCLTSSKQVISEHIFFNTQSQKSKHNFPKNSQKFFLPFMANQSQNLIEYFRHTLHI